MTWIVIMLGVVLFCFVMALRMSYEKYCLRIGKPFKSWLGKGK